MNKNPNRYRSTRPNHVGSLACLASYLAYDCDTLALQDLLLLSVDRAIDVRSVFMDHGYQAPSPPLANLATISGLATSLNPIVP